MLSRLFLVFFFAVFALTSCSEIRQPVLTATTTATELAPGKTAQITVTRQFPGGGPLENVTNLVRFLVTPRDVLDVSDTGLVTAGSQAGEAEVRITDSDGPASTSLRFRVTTARIVALRLEPEGPVTLAPGEARRFGAVAKRSDGTEADVTNNLVWASSHLAVAEVGQTQGDIGNVTGVRAGEATITATDALTNVQARAVVIVHGEVPTLAAITITPNPATVAVGASAPLTAIGVYSNGRTEDLTHSATWTSTDATKATVDANGVASGIAAGSVTITAADPAGLVKGSTALTIP